MKAHLTVGIVMAAVGLAVPAVDAEMMYATTASPGRLVMVDTETAALTLVGGMPFSASLTIAYDIAEHRIYTFDNATNELYSIDPDTGWGFAVGTLPYNFVHGFAYDAVHDVLYAHDIDTGHLFTINTADATTTTIGSTGYGYVGGIEYDPINDVLYGLEAYNAVGSGPRLFTIDPTTAAVSVLGTVPGLAGTMQWSLGFNPQDGMLYVSTEDYDFVRIDPATRATTVVGSTTDRLSGIASMVVPEPSALALMAALLLLRRRR